VVNVGSAWKDSGGTMKYADKINKYRREELPDLYKTVSCWAPFQAIHINKKGKIKPCPFSMQGANGFRDQVEWSPNKSIKECWNDITLDNIREKSETGFLHSSYCDYCLNQCYKDKPPSSLDYDHVGGEKSLYHEYPKEIELELSNKCNYMCDACSPWCSSEWVKKLGLENDTKFHSIFDDSVYSAAFVNDLRTFIHQVYRINFTGGEPFAQPIVYAILKMIEEEKADDVKIHFTTNGSVMNSAVKRMAQRKNTRFTVSLDSINPDTYPLIRVNGNLQNVIRNIDYLIETNDNTVGASFVLTKKNIMELPSIISWCNEKGIRFSYHILANMGYRDQKEIDNISIENEEKDYLLSLKEWLIESRNNISKGKDRDLCDKNIGMYNQYIERLK